MNTCGSNATIFAEAGEFVVLHPEVEVMIIEAYIVEAQHLASGTHGTIAVAALQALHIDVNFHMPPSQNDTTMRHQQRSRFVPNVTMPSKSGKKVAGRWRGAYCDDCYGMRAIFDTACGRRTMVMVETTTFN